MKKRLLKHLSLCLVIALPLLTGCNALLSKQPLQTTYYSLERVQFKTLADLTPNTNSRLPTLIINTPKAAAGFDTRRMMYTRAIHQVEYFAHNEWVDTPARMLQPLMVSAIEKTGQFNAVLPNYRVVKSELRLESDLVRLIQTFNSKPSKMLFTLRATIIDNTTNKVIASREFDEQADAVSDDPSGGVAAANQAVNTALEKLSAFSLEATISWYKFMETKPNKVEPN